MAIDHTKGSCLDKGIEAMEMVMADVTVIERRGLRVEIRSDDRFFTVWFGKSPVATIIRPLTYGNGKWEAVLADGTSLGFAIGPRTAFNLVAKEF